MAQPFQTYGGPPYNSAPYYPQYQQYGGSQASPPSFPQQSPVQVGGYQASPGMNIARFDGSQQPPHPPPGFPFAGPPPLNPELFKHLASSVPPPPPPHFPPVPLPNMGFPQFSQNSTPVAHTPIQQNVNHSARPPADADSYDPRYPQNIPQNMPQNMSQPPRFVAAPAPNYQSRSQADGQRDGPQFVNDQQRPFHQHNFTQTNRGAFEGNRYTSAVDGKFIKAQVMLVANEPVRFYVFNTTTIPNANVSASSHTRTTAHTHTYQRHAGKANPAHERETANHPSLQAGLAEDQSDPR